MGNKQIGLHEKFIVQRVDRSDQPGGKHEGCEYFVLDLSHDRFAAPALRTYAAACADDFPVLAADLREKASAMCAAGVAPAISADLKKLIDQAVREGKSVVEWNGIPVFINDGKGEERWDECLKNACLACGGSGHKDDAEVNQGFYDLVSHLHRQRDFSSRTFGPGVRTSGVIDHIRKELGEIEISPADVSEWVDVVLLALDGAWRAGFEPEQIAAAIKAKQERNEGRTWPDWRTAEPGKAIEHVRGEEGE